MSYFSIDANTINEEHDMIQMTHDKPTKRSPHNVPHSPEAKRKISETQQARYELMRTLIKRGQQKSITEERVKEIVDESIDRFLRTHATHINKSDNNRPMNINL